MNVETLVAAIVGALGAGGTLKLIDRWFMRDGRRMDEGASVRQEWRERVRELEARLDETDKELTLAREERHKAELELATLRVKYEALEKQFEELRKKLGC